MFSSCEPAMKVEVPIQTSAHVAAAAGMLRDPRAPAASACERGADPGAEKQLTSTVRTESTAISSDGTGSLVLTSAANSYLPVSASTGVQRYVQRLDATCSIDFHNVN